MGCAGQDLQAVQLAPQYRRANRSNVGAQVYPSGIISRQHPVRAKRLHSRGERSSRELS